MRLYERVNVVPRRDVSNRDVARGFADGDVDRGASFVNDGSKGRNGPPGKTNRKRERYGSCCAVVPSDARRRARFRSCSRIIEAVPGREVNLDIFRRSISRMSDRLNSPFRMRK